MKENKNNWLWDELQAKNIKIEALKSKNNKLVNENKILSEKIKILQDESYHYHAQINELKQQLNQYDD